MINERGRSQRPFASHSGRIWILDIDNSEELTGEWYVMELPIAARTRRSAGPEAALFITKFDYDHLIPQSLSSHYNQQ